MHSGPTDCKEPEAEAMAISGEAGQIGQISHVSLAILVTRFGAQSKEHPIGCSHE